MLMPVSSFGRIFQSLVVLFKYDLWYVVVLHRIVSTSNIHALDGKTERTVEERKRVRKGKGLVGKLELERLEARMFLKGEMLN